MNRVIIQRLDRVAKMTSRHLRHVGDVDAVPSLRPLVGRLPRQRDLLACGLRRRRRRSSLRRREGLGGRRLRRRRRNIDLLLLVWKKMNPNVIDSE